MFSEYPTEAALLAADVVRLESQLADTRRELANQRECVSVLLELLHRAFVLWPATPSSNWPR